MMGDDKLSLIDSVLIIENCADPNNFLFDLERVVRGAVNFCFHNLEGDYSYEDSAMLYAYLTKVAPYLHLTDRLKAEWRQFAKLAKNRDFLQAISSVEPYFDFNNPNLAVLFLNVGRIRKASHLPKRKKGKHHEFERPNEQGYDGARLENLDLSDEQSFLKRAEFYARASCLNPNSPHPTVASQGLIRDVSDFIEVSVWDFSRDPTPENDVLAYSSSVIIGPMFGVLNEKQMKSYVRKARNN